MVYRLHIVVARDGNIQEQFGGQLLQTIVSDIIAGNYTEPERVLRITPPQTGWPCHTATVTDMTSEVALAIANKCNDGRTHIAYNSPAYHLVEEYVGIAVARACLDPHSDEAA